MEEQFMSASRLDKEDHARKISTFLYSIGDEAEDILVSANITDESRNKYAYVMANLLSGAEKCEIRESEVQPARSRGRIG